jgi:7-keto-8-aminopelargonate synthetase-like enzyme
MAVEEPRHRFRDTAKMMRLSQENWQTVQESGLIDLFAAPDGEGHLVDHRTGHRFVNMSSYSYLGLNEHPDVIQGGIDALTSQRCTGLGITPTRIRPSLFSQVQDELSELFDAQCLYAASCSVATAGLLPLVASGALSGGEPRVTVFDKRSHFCMDYMKPACADEAPVLVAPHNDMEFLEDVCRRHPRVAYVADGAYSMGGVANLPELRRLQDRYGLFVWFDDSHAMSVMGESGEGFVRSRIDEVDELTLITASLEKGFGCSGGVVMLNRGIDSDFINTFAGPMCWSQTPSVANLGTVSACARLHGSPELGRLQRRLRENLELFDRRIPTATSGSQLPVRALPVGDRDLAISLSRKLFAEGFYCAPVHFPVTSRGREGLRVMVRANIEPGTWERFTGLLQALVVPHLLP